MPLGFRNCAHEEHSEIFPGTFASTTDAPDHVDHLHGLPAFLARLLRM